jgi:hypothetical protein
VSELPGGIEIHRGSFTLCVNLSGSPVRPPRATCVLASQPLSPAGDLAPVSCALFHR